jgi:hypothetical protein
MNHPDASLRQPTSLTGAGGRRVRPGSSRTTARCGSLSDDPLIISGTFDPKRAHLGSVIGREYEVRIRHLNDYRYRNISNPARRPWLLKADARNRDSEGGGGDCKLTHYR